MRKLLTSRLPTIYPLVNNTFMSLVFFCLSTVLSYAQTPQRIVSLSPNTTELIYSLGVEERLLAVSRFSNYPPEATEKPLIGDAFSVNIEQLVSINPDLILTWSAEPLSHHLKHLPHAQVWQSQAESISALLNEIQALAKLVESPKQEAIKTLTKYIQTLDDTYRSRPVRTGLLLINQQPLYVLTQESIQSDALALCGARNVFADIHQGAAIVNKETVLMRQADFVVYSFSDEQERKFKLKFIKHDLGLNLSDAQLIGVDSDTWSRPTVRFLESLAELCQRIDSLR